jgi:dihydrofolate reductase
MRKLIVTNIVSIDGFSAGPGGDVMALPMDDAFDAYNAERLRAADVLLTGRRTYQGFKGFWPAVAEDPAAAAERLGVPVEHIDTPANREIARLENAIGKVVVSDTLTPEQTDPWSDTTRIVRRAGAHEAIAELKRDGDGDIIVFGSRTLWNDLLAAGLVDELHLMVGAVVLGDGTAAFTAPPALRLIDTLTFDGSDNVVIRYSAS